jgi:hypothetical protein
MIVAQKLKQPENYFFTIVYEEWAPCRVLLCFKIRRLDKHKNPYSGLYLKQVFCTRQRVRLDWRGVHSIHILYETIGGLYGGTVKIR